MICFHFTIFVVLETTVTWFLTYKRLLWFAFILLSLSYWKQLSRFLEIGTLVVICFHFTIFVVLETTWCQNDYWEFALWFAFILLSLSYWKQQNYGYYEKDYVVICFHFTIFVVLETTKLNVRDWTARCDLLSFYYLCRTGNNGASSFGSCHTVVICFHFTIFVVLETTAGIIGGADIRLWFAFILLSLSYWKQLVNIYLQYSSRCDLLSFYYLCRTGNNTILIINSNIFVVICFHFTIFVVLETTA